MSYTQRSPPPYYQQGYDTVSDPYQPESKSFLSRIPTRVKIAILVIFVIFILLAIFWDDIEKMWNDVTCKNKGLTKSFGNWRWLNPLYLLQTGFNILPLLPNVCLM